MNRLVLLAIVSILAPRDSSQVVIDHVLDIMPLLPQEPKPAVVLPPLFENFTGVVHTVNKVKHFLNNGEKDFTSTWDDSLAGLADERVEKCPNEILFTNYSFFGKYKDFLELEQQLDSNISNIFFPKSLPISAVRSNGSMQLQLTIGSRIGCALAECSDSYDFLCLFEPRLSAEENIGIEACEQDANYTNLCVEQPFNYSSLDADRFKEQMMGWNGYRRIVAKAFNVPAMYELVWSKEFEETAELIANECDKFEGVLSEPSAHLYAHPRTLEPIGFGWLLAHHLPTSGVFPPTLPAIMSPNQKVFGCSPTNSTICKAYSYFCFIGPEPECKEIEPTAEDKLCTECSGDCFDGLCQIPIVEEQPKTVEVGRKAPEPEKLKDVEKTRTTTEEYMWDAWKFWTLAVCVVLCVAIAFFLIWTLVTTDYD